MVLAEFRIGRVAAVTIGKAEIHAGARRVVELVVGYVVAEQVDKGHGIYGLYPPTAEQTMVEFAAWRKMKGR